MLRFETCRQGYAPSFQRACNDVGDRVVGTGVLGRESWRPKVLSAVMQWMTPSGTLRLQGLSRCTL